MMQLAALLLAIVAVFAYIGYRRGWNKEVVATAGIILGVFAIYQFDQLVRVQLLGSAPRDQVFIIQAILFCMVVFFAYQTRALGRGENNRDRLQVSVLGLLIGSVNGYMVGGTLWYLMDINSYPLTPYITAPQQGTTNATMIAQIRALIEGGTGGNGEPLTLAIIILFIIVLIII
jgi:hypothetical protein